MTESTENQSIFQRRLWVSLFALTAAIVWGWAYPLIKLGFAEFGITANMTGSKMLFAGVRFMISGLIILAIAWRVNRQFSVRQRTDWWYILLFSLLNTTFHYAFFCVNTDNMTYSTTTAEKPAQPSTASRSALTATKE